MTDNDRGYIVQQRKMAAAEKDMPVFARVMKSKDGVFEGVSFIRNKDKASILTLAEAHQAIAWVKAKKPLANLYETTIIGVE